MKELFLINIGRQLGSGGRAVGEIISRRLGIRLYDKELLTLAAKQSGLCPACLLQGCTRTDFNHFHYSVPTSSLLFCHRDVEDITSYWMHCQINLFH